MTTKRTLSEAEMAKADAYDHEAEMAGIIADYEEELAIEAAEEEALCADIRLMEGLDRMVEHMEAVEAASQQRRILDELADRKEEDGGEYREILYP